MTRELDLGRRLGPRDALPLLLLLIAGCTDLHIPPYASQPYQAFSREAAVQIALREWRAFGQPVVWPNRELPVDNERAEGLWQRVGDYWWQGLSQDSPEQRWTGKHDASGQVFPAIRDADFAWSAAFIDYVMRMAGAKTRFVYSANHADYINAAKRQALGERRDLAITAEPLPAYAPQPGDLICMWRDGHRVDYHDLPTAHWFPSHCDIVVGLNPVSIDVIGGNVDNSVSLRRIPVAPDGRLARADGTVVDPDHPWFVVIRVDYDISVAPAARPVS